MAAERLGLYGGTYSPPHRGHIHSLMAFLEAEKPDRTLIMPNAVPPHKTMRRDETPEIRLEMCRAAFDSFENVEISSYETDKGGFSYTADTLEYLTKPGREILMLVGSDMFRTLRRWRSPDKIFALATVCCVARYGHESEELEEVAASYRRECGANVRIIPTDVIEISSTEIRERIAKGLPLHDLIPSAVETIIRRENLYRD